MRREIREATVSLTGLMTIRKGGKTYRYYRVKGQPLVKLPDLPTDHPDFLAAYAKARGSKLERRVMSAPGTVEAACELAMRSERFLACGASYQAIIARHLRAIMAQSEGSLLRDLLPEHIEEDLTPLAANVAGARLKAWRFLCQEAKRHRLRRDDPSAGVKAPRAKTIGHPAWEPDEIAAFRTRWPIGTAPRAAMELLNWTGARISDAVNLGPGTVGRDGVLAYRQAKTGGLAYVPWTCPVPPYAAQGDREAAREAVMPFAGHMTFLATAQGRTRSHKALGTMIRDAARAAGVAKSAHGLRKTRARSLAEGGATAHQIAAWTGHITLAEVQHYTEQADRRRAVMGRNENGANPDDLVQTVWSK